MVLVVSLRALVVCVCVCVRVCHEACSVLPRGAARASSLCACQDLSTCLWSTALFTAPSELMSLSMFQWKAEVSNCADFTLHGVQRR